jgi:DNA-binding IclR family transcriptional regulator
MPRPVNRSSPTAPARVAQILEQLAAARRDGLSLTELAAALEAPKTSLPGLLRGLLDIAYVVREANRYRLGPAAYRLAAGIIRIGASLDLQAAARPLLERLAAASGETVLLGTLAAETREVVFVERVESVHDIRFSVPIGARRPLYSSALGRVLLAYQPEAWREAYLKSVKLVPRTARTETRMARLREILAKIRVDGSVSTVEQSSRDVAGFAAPIFERDGRVAAGIVIAAPVGRGEKNAKQLLAGVRAAAREVSLALGFRES